MKNGACAPLIQSNQHITSWQALVLQQLEQPQPQLWLGPQALQLLLGQRAQQVADRRMRQGLHKQAFLSQAWFLCLQI
jgi:hypothetical protein